MLKIFFVLAIMCGAVFLAPQLADSQGFVHIATNDYIVETSLTTAVVIIAVTFLVLLTVLTILDKSFKLPGVAARAFGARRAARRQELQNEAALAFETGNNKKALNLLRKAGEQISSSSMLLGAKCAFAEGNIDLCRSYIERAMATDPKSDTACKMLRADMNLRLNNAEAALENLSGIADKENPGILKLMCRCHELNHDGEALEKLLPALKRKKVFSSEEYESIEKECAAFKAEKTASEAVTTAVVPAEEKEIAPAVKEQTAETSAEKKEKEAGS